MLSPDLSMQIPISKPCLLAVNKVQKIAKPLFDATGINFFSYARDFPNNTSFSMQTDNDLYFAWFESKSPYCSESMPNGIYSWDVIQNLPLQASAKQLNYAKGFHIFKKNKAFTEVISFGAPVGKMDILQFYINNNKLINKFLLYFKEKAASLITEATNSPIVIPNYMLSMAPVTQAQHQENIFSADTFRIKKYYFDDQHEIKLSERELECLALYIKGASTTQIAAIMKVKKVTADTFMRNVKSKFNCRTKSELFQKLWDLGILQSNGMFA